MKTAIDSLTRREREVAVLLAHGKTNRQIAAALVIEESTAENHVQHVLKKLEVANRTQAARYILLNPDLLAEVGQE